MYNAGAGCAKERRNGIPGLLFQEGHVCEPPLAVLVPEILLFSPVTDNGKMDVTTVPQPVCSVEHGRDCVGHAQCPDVRHYEFSPPCETFGWWDLWPELSGVHAILDDRQARRIQPAGHESPLEFICDEHDLRGVTV